MHHQKEIKYSIIVSILLCTCTEPFLFETIDYESILIVEGVITNEMKQHIVKISRSLPLDSREVIVEDQAKAMVESSVGHVYKFSQNTEEGIYISDESFAAESGVSYVLRINTRDGNRYTSNDVFLPKAVGVNRVYAEKGFRGDAEGVMIYIDSEETTNDGHYFRYDYEETFKIKVPKPSNWSWTIEDYDFKSGLYDLNLTRRKPETICYSTNYSTGILQTSTAEFAQNRVLYFPIHFIYKSSQMLRERYSILVKQYVQSLDAYTFYKTVNDLGKEDNLLSQGQPGFATGNLRSTTDPPAKVLGFFEAAFVATKRIYFNYKNFGFQFPPYFDDCTRTKIFPTALLINKLEKENYQIQDFEEDGPVRLFHIYKDICTDCTSFSSNVKPNFWED